MPVTDMRVSRSQGEDVDVVISGTVNVIEDPLVITLFDPEGSLPCTTARLMRVTFSLESGLLALLYWERDDEHDLILPLEGRGMLDFREYSGMQNPRRDGWTGRIILRVTSTTPYVGTEPRHFALAVDLSKQRN